MSELYRKSIDQRPPRSKAEATDNYKIVEICRKSKATLEKVYADKPRYLSTFAKCWSNILKDFKFPWIH